MDGTDVKPPLHDQGVDAGGRDGLKSGQFIVDLVKPSEVPCVQRLHRRSPNRLAFSGGRYKKPHYGGEVFAFVCGPERFNQAERIILCWRDLCWYTPACGSVWLSTDAVVWWSGDDFRAHRCSLLRQRPLLLRSRPTLLLELRRLCG